VRLGGAREDLGIEVGQFVGVFPLVRCVPERDKVRRLPPQLDVQRVGGWASLCEPDETRFSGFCGQVRPGVTGRTFAIRVASAGVNSCSCSSPPLQPPTTIAATTAIAPRVMATVTTRDPRTGCKPSAPPRMRRRTFLNTRAAEGFLPNYRVLITPD
jgi:hypothetical protein